MTRLLILCLLLAAPAAAQNDAPSYSYKAGGKFTGGSGGYRGRSAYIQAGSTWKLRAGYSGYDFDGATQTFHSGSLRANYQGEHFSAGVNGSFAPLTEDYRSRGWGAELGWLFTPGDADESALVDEWDIGAYWSGVRHHQTVPATAANPQRELIINQNDMGGSISATVGIVTLALDGFTTVYDQENFGVINVLARNRPRLAAAANLVNGLPQDGQSARLDVEATDWAVPYITVSRTSYVVLSTPASSTIGAGVSLRWERWGAELGWERNRQEGSDDQRYFSLGLSARF